MKSFAAEFYPEVYESGLNEGRNQGRSEGRTEGLGEEACEILFTLAGARFGVLPVVLTTKIKNIHDVTTLSTLALGLQTAETIEVFESLVDKALAGTPNNHH